jgi:hypothetical protein
MIFLYLKISLRARGRSNAAAYRLSCLRRPINTTSTKSAASDEHSTDLGFSILADFLTAYTADPANNVIG